MDSADDDFGEVYVDAKVQASAIVAGGVGFGESECVAISEKDRGFEGMVKPESQGETKNFGVVAKDSSPCVDACAVNLMEANEESEYSDSDDDLNIVLKDDDSKVLPVARGSNTNNGGYAVADAVEASKPCSFQKPWTGNWCTMPNGGMVNGRISIDASANNVWIDPSLGMSQCGYSFSHPWSRTSFDGFKKKPWRNPGREVNDFFNYGFNEQSWKDYCKPLGRAIEVGGGTLERIPSADLRRPRDSDPDVVIEIPMTNDVEELSGKTPVEARSPSPSTTSNEASRSEEDLHSDRVNDLSSPDNSIKEEAFVGCQDENTGSSSGGQSPPKENCYSREVTPCDKEVVEEEKEETCWNSDEVDPSSVERESSPGDRIRFSPTSSHSAGRNEDSENSETESSKGGAIDDQRENSTPPRRTRYEEHEAISIKSVERSGTKHSRHRRSHEDQSTRHCGRADYGVHRRIKHGTVKDPDFGKKACSRHGSLYRDSSKNWQNRPLPHSNREKRDGRLYPSVDRDLDRDHRFGWRSNKESSQGRGFDHSNGYKYEARLKEYTSRSSFNPNQRNSLSSFKEEEHRYGRRHCERKYGRERSSDLAYESNKERNQYDWLRESYYQDRIPLTDMDYRYRSEYSSAHGRHNPKQSYENDLHCRRRDDYDYNFPRHRYEDGVHREESRIPSDELAYRREMHSFAEVGRREFQGYERNQEFSEIDIRHHYTSDWHRDRSVSEKDDYYRIQDAWPSQSRDSWYTKGSRGDSWRDDYRDFTTTEAYEIDSQNNQLYKAAPRDGWKRNLVHSDYVSIQDRLTYEDDLVRRDRGRYELVDDIQSSMREEIRMPTYNRMSTKQRSGYFKSHIHEIDEGHHGSKKLRRDGHAFIKCQDPVDLTGRQGKLSNQPKRRFSNGEDTIEEQEHQKPRKVICRNNAIRDMNDKEEGEIVEEAKKEKGIEIDKERIQESLKKMEKRRERFKEIESVRTVVATFNSQAKPGAKADDTNQQRPVRKRRWCASAS